MKNHPLFSGLTKYIFCFIIGSLVGWLYEVVLGLIVTGVWSDRGILNLPLCPIYGFGVLLILAALGEKRKRKLLYIFLYGFIISTVLELIASYLIEWILHIRLWSYEQWPLHFEWRISLPSSIIFGLFSLLVIGLIYPLIEKTVPKMPLFLRILLDITLLAVVAADAVFSILI